MATTKITFGLVVYHEEALLRRCLESIKDVADEIIVVHDGPCSDKTLAIAKEYTNKVIVGDRIGGSDPHRLLILKESSNDWVFMIDADEFLSVGLQSFLKNATLEANFGAYSFKWPLWNGSRYVTMTNYRACLFNKPKVWAIGLHNFSIQTAEPIKKIDLVLEHQPAISKVSFSRFSGQLKKRLERDANCFAKGFEALPKYNEALIPETFKQWFASYLAHPLRYAFTDGIKYFLGTLKNNWRDGYYGLVVSFQAGIYRCKLAYRIYKILKH
jgi:glycosyltransferase involved in cell wall biosynthesis